MQPLFKRGPGRPRKDGSSGANPSSGVGLTKLALGAISALALVLIASAYPVPVALLAMCAFIIKAV